MKHLFAIFTVSALALAPGLAQAAVAPAAMTQPDAQYEKALRFVQLLNSVERVTAQIRDGYFKGFRATVAQDPRSRALEERFPGVFDEIAEATLPYLQKMVLDHLPELWRRQAVFLAKNLTAAELDDCIAYFTSPAGLHMIDAIVGSFAGDSILAEAAGGKPEMTSEGLARDIAAAVPGALGKLSPSDTAGLLAFSRTAGGRKLTQFNSGMVDIVTAWSNEVLSDPGFVQEVQRQAERVVQRRLKEKGQ